MNIFVIDGYTDAWTMETYNNTLMILTSTIDNRMWLSKGPGKRGHIVADTLLPMMFLGLRKLGNICCGHKMFLNKIRNIFVSQTQNLCPQQMLHAWANRETFVSATMCPQQSVRNNVSSFARALTATQQVTPPSQP